MKWKKLGNIYNQKFETQSCGELFAGMHPTANIVSENEIDIYFGPRDTELRTRVFLIRFDMQKMQIVRGPTLALDLGNIGTFDDTGCTPFSIINMDDGMQWLYYAGVNVWKTVPFSCDCGVAEILSDGKLKRLFEGPVLSRNTCEPFFTSSPHVIRDGDIYKVWYLSCVGWGDRGNLKHRYHIKYAESLDGIQWVQNGTIAIDFANEHEYAFARPCVIKDEDNYKMWYCFRASENINTYRIGYAESIDGKQWERKDHLAGIDVSESGWDSEMICYPYVFDFQGKRYMLYNGNGYGRTGFGLAVLEED